MLACNKHWCIATHKEIFITAIVVMKISFSRFPEAIKPMVAAHYH